MDDNKRNDNKNLIQIVVLTLRDGRKVRFTGPVQFTEEEVPRVKNIATWTEELPDGCAFEALEDFKG